MRAPIEAELATALHPREARRAALVAGPLLAVEYARRGGTLKVPFGLRHLSRAFMSRDFELVRGPFTIRAIDPGARELAMLVTMRGADLHHFACYQLMGAPPETFLPGPPEHKLADLQPRPEMPVVNSTGVA